MLARMRWDWAAESQAPVQQSSAFVDEFRTWFERHRETHFAFLAAAHGDAVGMAWLALLPRVPEPDAVARVGADVQSVYVDVAYRNAGVGRNLIEMALAHARATGAEHVTVQAGRRSLPLYERIGFRTSARLLRLVSQDQ